MVCTLETYITCAWPKNSSIHVYQMDKRKCSVIEGIDQWTPSRCSHFLIHEDKVWNRGPARNSGREIIGLVSFLLWGCHLLSSNLKNNGEARTHVWIIAHVLEQTKHCLLQRPWGVLDQNTSDLHPWSGTVVGVCFVSTVQMMHIGKACVPIKIPTLTTISADTHPVPA
jgi:hypothetical protein